MNKRRFLISTLVGIGATAALTGGVLAATNGHRGGVPEEVTNRVAEILGIDADDLTAAIEQARDEARDAALAEKLAALVEAGTITQEQADEIAAWYDAQPEALDVIAGLNRSCLGLSDTRLANLVENGTLTQEQADEIAAWRDARPPVLDELSPSYRGFRGHGGRHGRFGHGFGGGLRGFGGGFNFGVPGGIPGGLELIVPSADGNSA